MFSIISVMFLGITIGYLMRNLVFLAKINKSASLTVCILLFVLGISMGSNNLIIGNMGKFGWQAIILAIAGISGSILASFVVFHFFFKKGGNHEK